LFSTQLRAQAFRSAVVAQHLAHSFEIVDVAQLGLDPLQLGALLFGEARGRELQRVAKFLGSDAQPMQALARSGFLTAAEKCARCGENGARGIGCAGRFRDSSAPALDGMAARKLLQRHRQTALRAGAFLLKLGGDLGAARIIVLGEKFRGDVEVADATGGVG